MSTREACQLGKQRRNRAVRIPMVILQSPEVGTGVGEHGRQTQVTRHNRRTSHIEPLTELTAQRQRIPGPHSTRDRVPITILTAHDHNNISLRGVRHTSRVPQTCQQSKTGCIHPGVARLSAEQVRGQTAGSRAMSRFSRRPSIARSITPVHPASSSSRT